LKSDLILNPNLEVRYDKENCTFTDHSGSDRAMSVGSGQRCSLETSQGTACDFRKGGKEMNKVLFVAVILAMYAIAGYIEMMP